MRGRRSLTSMRPSFSPRTSTVPLEGKRRAAAMRETVVLPAPLGPRTTQCWPSSTTQLTWERIWVSPRCRETSVRRSTLVMGLTLARTRDRGPNCRPRVCLAS